MADDFVTVPSDPFPGPVADAPPTMNQGPTTGIPASSMGSFFKSPAGAAVIGAAGSGLVAAGQAQQSGAALAQSAQQFAANKAQQDYDFAQQQKQAAATGVLNADPLGADQKFSQHNAMMQAILGNLKPISFQTGDAGINAAMGNYLQNNTSGIPAGGFDKGMLAQMYGPDATMNSIVQRHKEINSLDPSAAQPDLTGMYGSAAIPKEQQVAQWAQNLQNLQGADKAAYEQQLTTIINANAAAEQKSSGPGFWSKLAQVAIIVGAGAAIAMTGGIAAPMVIGAAAGAANGLIGGGGVKGALIGGALGGVTVGIAGGASGAVAPSLSSALASSAVKSSPALLGAVLNK